MKLVRVGRGENLTEKPEKVSDGSWLTVSSLSHLPSSPALRIETGSGNGKDKDWWAKTKSNHQVKKSNSPNSKAFFQISTCQKLFSSVNSTISSTIPLSSSSCWELYRSGCMTSFLMRSIFIPPTSISASTFWFLVWRRSSTLLGSSVRIWS